MTFDRYCSFNVAFAMTAGRWRPYSIVTLRDNATKMRMNFQRAVSIQ
jgi:hypothetical protein